MSKTTCPVYKPTHEEFLDFETYMDKIEKECAEIGIAKVIPPAGLIFVDKFKEII